jgi:hypothetical protein
MSAARRKGDSHPQKGKESPFLLAADIDCDWDREEG